MVQKYQNEIAPIFYYGISTKTNEKDLKIPNFQPPDWKSPYWMTLYNNKDDKDAKQRFPGVYMVRWFPSSWCLLTMMDPHQPQMEYRINQATTSLLQQESYI